MIGSVSWPRFSLRTKIVVPFVLVVALVGTIGTAVVSAQVTNESVAEFDGSLLRASLLANDHLSLLEAARLTTLRAAADTTGVAEGTLQHDNAALQRLLTPVVANAGVNSLVVRVLDRQGSEIIALEPGGLAPPSIGLADQPAVAAVLAGRTDALGDKYVFIASDPAGESLYWTGPIRAGTGDVVGAALVGEPLSAIAGGIAASGATELAFYEPAGEALFSSQSSTGRLPSAIRKMVQSDKPVRFNEAINGQAFTALVSDWTMRNVRLGYLTVALDATPLQASQDQLRLLLLGLFSAAALITLVIGLLPAGAITR